MWIPLSDKWPHFQSTKVSANCKFIVTFRIDYWIRPSVMCHRSSHTRSAKMVWPSATDHPFFSDPRRWWHLLSWVGIKKIIHDNSNFHRFKFQTLKMIWLLLQTPKFLTQRWSRIQEALLKIRKMTSEFTEGFFIQFEKSIFCPKIHFRQNPNIFTSFSQFFSWNQSCQQQKSPKPQHCREFFKQTRLEILPVYKREFESIWIVWIYLNRLNLFELFESIWI